MYGKQKKSKIKQLSDVLPESTVVEDEVVLK